MKLRKIRLDLRSGGDINEDSTEPWHDLANDHKGQNRAVEPKTHNEACTWEKSCQGSVLSFPVGRCPLACKNRIHQCEDWRPVRPESARAPGIDEQEENCRVGESKSEWDTAWPDQQNQRHSGRRALRPKQGAVNRAEVRVSALAGKSSGAAIFAAHRNLAMPEDLTRELNQITKIGSRHLPTQSLSRKPVALEIWCQNPTLRRTGGQTAQKTNRKRKIRENEAGRYEQHRHGQDRRPDLVHHSRDNEQHRN
jgi:hypothetical protein